MEEIWKDVEGYEGFYQVSDHGRVKSFYRTGKLLSFKIDRYGYYCCGLWDGNKIKHYTVHRLVAKTFLKNPLNLKVVNHKDGNKLNNYKDNLEWTTVQKNTIHAYKNIINKKYKTISDLTEEDIKLLVKLYSAGMEYQQLKTLFKLTCRTDNIGNMLSGKRFSEITGITEDIRRESSKKYSVLTEDLVSSILEDFYRQGLSQKGCCDKYKVSPAQIHRIVKGERWADTYKDFMEKYNG